MAEIKAVYAKKEEKYEADMEKAGFQIFDAGGAGNCLFRSFAYQLYGDYDQHRLVRVKCMKYILAEKEYFGSYIEGGVEKVEEYT